MLILAAVLTGGLLLPLALLKSTGFCTAGKAGIAAVVERAAESATEAAVFAAVEAEALGEVVTTAAVEAPVEGEAEATTTVALDAPDA
jgi:hypothetical protein